MSGVRRAQLIAPFGIGSIVAMRQGRTVVVGGLDHWFSEHTLSEDRVALDEFIVDEPRLSRHLGVRQLRLPPDYRRSMPFASGAPNVGMSVPALRFPRWHVCKICRRLSRFSAEGVSRLTCPVEGCRGRQIQVRFVAMCPEGHLDDFPWREWAHSMANPSCERPMRLEVRGSASLDALWIVCECGKKRSLSGITVFDRDKGTSILTDELASSEDYRCQGRRPWVNDFSGSGCGEYLVGTLLNATNVYFADVRSSIFLPAEATSVVAQRALELIEGSPIIEDDIALMRQMSSDVTQIASMLRKRHQQQLGVFPEAEIARALEAMVSPEAHGVNDALADDRDELKRGEYPVLQQSSTREDLRIRGIPLDEFGPIGPEQFQRFFARVQLVDKLRETRAFTGFTRITSPSGAGRANTSARPPYPMLWKDAPQVANAWLPAYVVHGEGIFLEFDEERLREWEERTPRNSRSRLQAIAMQWARFNPAGATAPVSQRFVMMHTFSHLVINQLVFESGYSTAAVRERIYSAEGEKPMAALLLYTASGDSEGTMGGLVALGEPSRLEGIIVRALEAASWCSADPVCMEAGARGGQGPDSCNLAACHSCALLPETSCEALNRFLDRGLVIGTPDDPALGFFASVLT